LVEATLIVSLLGVVLAVGIPAFARAVRTSKMAEAPEQLQRIYAAAAAYYATPHTPHEAPPSRPGASGRSTVERVDSSPLGPRTQCLPTAAGPTPDKPSSDPVQVDFGAADVPASATWRALGYQPQEPLRYRYTFAPQRSGCGLQAHDGETLSLTLRAEGDLDADGVLSSFERTATLGPGGLNLDPMLTVRDRVE
jgi:hypothetical protein